VKYAIQTLEIEIARVRSALRKANELHIPYVDTQEGYTPDFQGMQSAIRNMERAIEVLKEWEANQPKPEAY
jgi:hypothetical protein